MGLAIPSLWLGETKLQSNLNSLFIEMLICIAIDTGQPSQADCLRITRHNTLKPVNWATEVNVWVYGKVDCGS